MEASLLELLIGFSPDKSTLKHNISVVIFPVCYPGFVPFVQWLECLTTDKSEAACEAGLQQTEVQPLGEFKLFRAGYLEPQLSCRGIFERGGDMSSLVVSRLDSCFMILQLRIDLRTSTEHSGKFPFHAMSPRNRMPLAWTPRGNWPEAANEKQILLCGALHREGDSPQPLLVNICASI